MYHCELSQLVIAYTGVGYCVVLFVQRFTRASEGTKPKTPHFLFCAKPSGGVTGEARFMETDYENQ